MSFDWDSSYTLQDFVDEFHNCTIYVPSEVEPNEEQEGDGEFTSVWDKITMKDCVEKMIQVMVYVATGSTSVFIIKTDIQEYNIQPAKSFLPAMGNHWCFQM